MTSPASLSIIRPINSAMIGFAVIVGAFVSKPASIPVTDLLLGYLTGFAICAYSMVINDYYDIEVDRINQPTRPLPSGRITVRTALILAFVLLVLGVATALLTGILTAVAVALVYAFFSWIYNYRAKKYGIAGNLIVSSSLAIPFLYGGVVVGGHVLNSLLLFMALTSFLAGTGREVVKAMADTVGDETRGIRSVAIAQGLRGAAGVGAVLFLLAVVTSQIPVIEAQTNTFYDIGVLVPDAIFVYLAFSILRRSTEENALKVKKTALLGMLVGLIVFIGGAL